MRILMITPMPPQQQAANGVPLVTYALLHGLSQHHDVTLATLAGPDANEYAALHRLKAEGFDVRAIIRQSGQRRLHTTMRLAASVLGGREPLRSGWYWDARMQALIDALLNEQQFDIIQLDDNATGTYKLRTRTPIVLTEHEVRRPRPLAWKTSSSASLSTHLWQEDQWRRWPGYQPVSYTHLDVYKRQGTPCAHHRAWC